MNLNSKISVNNIEKYKKITIIPTAEELVALADYLNILHVLKLKALLTLKKQNDYILLNGDITTTIIQECSLSGEDLIISMGLPLERKYMHQYKNPKLDATTNKNPNKFVKELDIPLEDDEIEVLPTHEISCFHVIAEALLLEINPFIKKDEYEGLTNKT